MLRDRRSWGIWLPVCLIVAAFIGSAISQQRSAGTVADPAAVGNAESLSSAFRSAANEVLPTVVKIKSRVNARRVRRQNGRGENPYRGTPFEDFFGNDPRFSMPLEQHIPRQVGTGSGVIIGEDGLILTNNHVVKDADEVTVELADGRIFKAEDIRTDPKTDIAIVRISGAGTLPVARLGSSDELEIGDWVLAIGNPFELEASVSAGIISAKGRSLGAAERTNFLQTDAAINPGNSGGPLVNLKGQVVGINTAIASSSGGYQGIGFAIPADLAKWVIEQLISNGSVSRAFLGVGISEVNQDDAEALGIDSRIKGVIVKLVNDDSPAEHAGVQPGDIITHFGDQSITNPSQLQRAVERAPLSSRQKIRVIRRGREIELTVVTVALRDKAAQAAGAEQEEDSNENLTANDLGVQVADLTRTLIDRLGLPADAEGVVVVEVDPRGIARTNGIQPGTLIMEISGTEIKSVKDFEKAVDSIDIKKGVRLIVRDPGVGTRFIVLKRR